MPTPLRPVQQKLESDIYAAWNAGAQNIMPVAATGFGKTVVLAKLLYDEPAASVAIAHRRELVSQISVALARNGVRHRLVGVKKGSSLTRIISALHVFELGHSYIDPNAKTGVGGVDTIIRMDASDPWFNQVRLMVQDEGHHVLKENKWGKAATKFPNARGLFPTATPIRADGKGLGRHADGLADALVLAPSMREIIDMGYLTDYRVVSIPSSVNMGNVEIGANGDFKHQQLADAIANSSIVGDVVGHYKKYADGKLGCTFAVDVKEAAKIAEAYRNAGVTSQLITADTPDMLRAQILRDFKGRRVMQLVNVDLFGEGFDLPALECVSFARHTASFSLFAQQFGRVLRLMLPSEVFGYYDSLTDAQRREIIARSDKPRGMIIDQVGNIIRHNGPPDRHRVWSLDRRDARGGSASDAIPMRNCLNPQCAWPYERVKKCCPYCGTYPPSPAERSAPEYVDGDLTEYSDELLAQMRGQIARIDGDATIPYGAAPEVAGAVRRRHWERQQAQKKLRNSIAWWAGLGVAKGWSESESYRHFWFKFGIDVAGCQILGTREAEELNEKIIAYLAQFGIDGSVNAGQYFE